MVRRRVRLTRGKLAIQHSDSIIANTGQGSAPATFVVSRTDVGARTLTGATQNIQAEGATDEKCQVGDLIKYVNLFIQHCPRPNVGSTSNRTGWLEWAFVCVKESEAPVLATLMGTQTLGDVCTKMYRNECIYTGVSPCGEQQSAYLAITIKIPKFKQYLRIGDQWRFITFWRSSSSTDVTTDTHRLMKSYMYKSYN